MVAGTTIISFAIACNITNLTASFSKLLTIYGLILIRLSLLKHEYYSQEYSFNSSRLIFRILFSKILQNHKHKSTFTPLNLTLKMSCYFER